MGERDDDVEDHDLIRAATSGDQAALVALFGRHRARLERMVRARLHQALRGRVDPADVLQEVFLDLGSQLAHYPGPEAMRPFLWLRLLTGQRLTRTHRHHLGAAMRSAGREVTQRNDGGAEADAGSIADQLAASLTTASQALSRDERARLVRDAIETLDPTDREIISLRNFEGLTNNEAAATLGLTKAAASNRYVRAMARLQVALQNVPGLLEGPRG